MGTDTVKVVVMAGSARSGSTLLDLMLGQINGFFTVGELYHIWQRGFTENRLCGCGKPFSECVFWNSVMERTLERIDNFSLDEIRKFTRSKVRTLGLPQLAFRFLRTSDYRRQLLGYMQVLSSLYRAISEVAGARVIIDSSKHPAHVLLLSQMSNIDVYFVHLVRDSRAVAYSQQRKKRRPDIHWQVQYTRITSPWGSVMRWSLANTIAQSLRNVSAHYQLVRYEELACQPKKVLLRILENVGEPHLELDFLRNSPICLRTTHGLSGNPIRFQGDTIEVRPDIEWREKMPGSQKHVVTALTWPLLLKYGYLRRHPM